MDTLKYPAEELTASQLSVPLRNQTAGPVYAMAASDKGVSAPPRPTRRGFGHRIDELHFVGVTSGGGAEVEEPLRRSGNSKVGNAGVLEVRVLAQRQNADWFLRWLVEIDGLSTCRFSQLPQVLSLAVQESPLSCTWVAFYLCTSSRHPS